jgi:hypothetical protein
MGGGGHGGWRDEEEEKRRELGFPTLAPFYTQSWPPSGKPVTPSCAPAGQFQFGQTGLCARPPDAMAGVSRAYTGTLYWEGFWCSPGVRRALC